MDSAAHGGELNACHKQTLVVRMHRFVVFSVKPVPFRINEEYTGFAPDRTAIRHTKKIDPVCTK